MEKKRLGSDPLEWIKDTRKEEKGESKQAEAKSGSQAIEIVKIA